MTEPIAQIIITFVIFCVILSVLGQWKDSMDCPNPNIVENLKDIVGFAFGCWIIYLLLGALPRML